jgi:hypothetical protein
LVKPRVTCQCDIVIANGRKRRRRFKKESSINRSRKSSPERLRDQKSTGKGKKKKNQKAVSKGNDTKKDAIQSVNQDFKCNDRLDHKHKPPDTQKRSVLGKNKPGDKFRNKDINFYFKPGGA